jgi:hypothetical protein
VIFHVSAETTVVADMMLPFDRPRWPRPDTLTTGLTTHLTTADRAAHHTLYHRR